LPAVEEGATEAPLTAATPASSPSKLPQAVARVLTLLLVDDEAMVADVTRRMLERHGHKVLVATKPHDALALWAEHAAQIDLVICDVVMTQMRGPLLVARMRESGKAPRVLFITGYSEEAVRSELDHPVLAKPFTLDALLQAIRSVLP
ncbi:MAG TPA: response regulator, partial [Polyangiales bacterium]|nr:response regulator [Polyangiales bacterium]